LFTTYGAYSFLDSESTPGGTDQGDFHTPDERAYIKGAEVNTALVYHLLTTNTAQPTHTPLFNVLQLEPYYIQLSPKCLQCFDYDWGLMAEGVYLQYGALLVGACYDSPSEGRKMVLNPSPLEVDTYGDGGAAARKAFFEQYTVGVLLSDSALTAGKVVQGMSDSGTLEKIVQAVVDAEHRFRVRALADGADGADGRDGRDGRDRRRGSVSSRQPSPAARKGDAAAGPFCRPAL